MFPHTLPGRLLERTIKVILVGAGGSGSQMLTGLAQLNHAMQALGHPGGLDVTVIDDDTVSHANVGRQMFYPSDVGKYKAEVLVNRINMAMGCDWKAVVGRVNRTTALSGDIVIGCVDTRTARDAINQASQRGRVHYWLDLGNRKMDGQTILGEVDYAGSDKDRVRLPTVADLYPETCDPSQESDDDGPSCSLAEALEKQSLFINRGVSLYALNMLFELFRYGGLSYSGVFVNLKTARTSPLTIDQEGWKTRFGYVTGPVKKSKKRKAKSKEEIPY